MLKHKPILEHKKLISHLDNIHESSTRMNDGRSIGPGKIFLDLAKDERDPYLRRRLLFESAKYIDGNNHMFESAIFPFLEELKKTIHSETDSEKKKELFELIRFETKDFLARIKAYRKNIIEHNYKELINPECIGFFQVLIRVLYTRTNSIDDENILHQLNELRDE
jgi:hypothetical protein